MCIHLHCNLDVVSSWIKVWPVRGQSRHYGLNLPSLISLTSLFLRCLTIQPPCLPFLNFQLKTDPSLWWTFIRPNFKHWCCFWLSPDQWLLIRLLMPLQDLFQLGDDDVSFPWWQRSWTFIRPNFKHWCCFWLSPDQRLLIILKMPLQDLFQLRDGDFLLPMMTKMKLTPIKLVIQTERSLDTILFWSVKPAVARPTSDPWLDQC